MRKQSDEIFFLELASDRLKPLPSRSMREGIFGKNLEDALQTLLQEYPQIIPGKQIDPDSSDPPRFVLLRREMPIGSWSLDHLYVDQRGVLTLVETKLIQNPEARRDVIGQIIEYAAHAVEWWASGRARQSAGEFWGRQGRELDDLLGETFGLDAPEDVKSFWEMVEDNLQQGRIRLMIAADELRPEVRRMIEYLNGEMQNAEVLGLELSCYGEENEPLVLVPRIVGQSEATRQTKRRSRRSSSKTTEEEFWSNCSPESQAFFAELFAEVPEHEIMLSWGSKGFSLRVPVDEKQISVFYGYPSGAFERAEAFVRGEARFLKNPEYRERVYRRFLEIPHAQPYGEYSMELALVPENLTAARQALERVWSIAEELARHPEWAREVDES